MALQTAPQGAQERKPASLELDNSQYFNVLVTGFAPFKKTHPINPSGLIASSLPSQLPFPQPSSPNTSVSPSHPRQIRLITPPEPLPVSYDYIRTHIPSLYTLRSATGESIPIDLALHIGMAAGRTYYALETKAEREGYTVGDVDGRLCAYGLDGKRLEREERPGVLVDGVGGSNTAIAGAVEEGSATSTRASSLSTASSRVAGSSRDSPITIPDDLDKQEQGNVDSLSALEPYLTQPKPDDWTQVPRRLCPTFDIPKVHQKWVANLRAGASKPTNPDITDGLKALQPSDLLLYPSHTNSSAQAPGRNLIPDVRISTDAGRYLCEYIFYASMAHWNLREREGKDVSKGERLESRVLFLHVPKEVDEEAIQRGVRVVETLVTAAVSCLVEGPEWQGVRSSGGDSLNQTLDGASAAKVPTLAGRNPLMDKITHSTGATGNAGSNDTPVIEPQTEAAIAKRMSFADLGIDERETAIRDKGTNEPKTGGGVLVAESGSLAGGEVKPADGRE